LSRSHRESEPRSPGGRKLRSYRGKVKCMEDVGGAHWAVKTERHVGTML
jgi:hypothetical protein